MWPDRLPASVAFCDVETTGLGNHDRIASFGGIGMISRNLVKGWPELEYVYLVFNPGTQIGRVAEQIHGFSASALRLQDPFAIHAADIHCFLTSYELLVAHNAAFDIRFINRELRLSGLPALTRPIYCTMKGYRALGRGGSASLSAVCRHIKLARAGDLHDAIEDAWLAMQIYLWLQGCPLQPQLRSLLPRTPSNLRLPKIGAYHVGRTWTAPTSPSNKAITLSHLRFAPAMSLAGTAAEPSKGCIPAEGVRETSHRRVCAANVCSPQRRFGCLSATAQSGQLLLLGSQGV